MQKLDFNYKIQHLESRCRRDIREICCDTADRGRPIDPIFLDRELMADLITRFYTDIEPRTTWVVLQESNTIAYLTASFNTSQFRKKWWLSILPRALGSALLRPSFWKKQTLKFLIALIRTLLQQSSFKNRFLHDYPAHLHINVKAEFRQKKLGEKLIHTFVTQALSEGVPGVHAITRSDNEGACRFFTRMGFQELERRPCVWPNQNGYCYFDTVIYGKRLV